MDEGRELYRAPFSSLAALERDVKSVCHGCFKDIGDQLRNLDDKARQFPACSGCKMARYCSKVRRIPQDHRALLGLFLGLIFSFPTGMPAQGVASLSQKRVQITQNPQHNQANPIRSFEVRPGPPHLLLHIARCSLAGNKRSSFSPPTIRWQWCGGSTPPHAEYRLRCCNITIEKSE